MGKPLIEVFTCESGDWQVLRMNLGEDFEYSGHSIPTNTWIHLLKVLGYKVEEKILSDEDMEMENY